jgi:integrase
MSLQVAAGVVRDVAGTARAKFGLHALRRAAVALFIEQGLSPKRIQTILRHSSIKTFDLYGYFFRSDDEDKAAMASIEARLLQ